MARAKRAVEAIPYKGNYMRAILRTFLCACFLTSVFVLSSGVANTQVVGAATDVPVLHTGTTLVVIDVTVQDKHGQPVHDLKREDFTLTEDRQSQMLRYFEAHSNQAPPPVGPELPPMPPGTFTNYTATPSNGELNILLLDTLNTPMADQSYVRNQLQQFVKKAKPGTNIAIFGLSQRLFLLQGFSSDSRILKEAVAHKLIPRASSLLDDAQGSGNASDTPSDLASNMMSGAQDSSTAALAATVSSMQQFEAEQKAFQSELRIRYTLDAFNMLAHYLSAFPGRKNLMWFSGSFPINILPDPNLQNATAVMENNDPEYRQTINLLSRARVAVYPLDARGLMVDPTFSATSSMKKMGSSGDQGKAASSFYQSEGEEHMTMSQLAEDTGGKAFYDTNDLATAVQEAIQSGSNYYALSYSPKDRNWNGAYRDVRVTLNGNLQAAGYTLTYRHGYYADDPSAPPKGLDSGTSAAATAPSSSEIAYSRAAMAHGAPTPQDILFKVRVVPVGTEPEQTLAAANVTNPTHPMKPPFRSFAVDFAVVGSDIQLAVGKDGRHTGNIEFNVFLYDNDGSLMNATGKAIQLNLTPEAYKRFLSGVNAHFVISVPAKGGPDMFLRVGVHDVSSNHFGVVEVPVASVAHLKALPAETLPAAPIVPN